MDWTLLQQADIRDAWDAVKRSPAARQTLGVDMNLDPLTSREQAEAEDMERQDDWAEAQHKALLESYVKRIWQHTSHYYVKGIGHPRTLLHRLEMVVRLAHKVERQGVAEGREDDYQLDLLLTEWGAGKLIAYFGALAETEGQ